MQQQDLIHQLLNIREEISKLKDYHMSCSILDQVEVNLSKTDISESYLDISPALGVDANARLLETHSTLLNILARLREQVLQLPLVLPLITVIIT